MAENPTIEMEVVLDVRGKLDEVPGYFWVRVHDGCRLWTYPIPVEARDEILSTLERLCTPLQRLPDSAVN